MQHNNKPENINLDTLEKSKEFIVSTPDVNRSGFSVLTSGIDLRFFEKNPVMLYNHERRGQLPIGRWGDIRIEDNKLIATAYIDTGDSLGKDIFRKIELGVLNSASIGIRVLELSEDTEHLQLEQTPFIVTKCELREISVVDIPCNAEAVVLNANDEQILLSDLYLLSDNNTLFIKNNNPIKMNTEEIKNPIALIDGLRQELSTLKKETDVALANLNQELVMLKVTNGKTAATTLVESALAAGKITKAQEAEYIILASNNYDAVKKIFDGMQGYNPIHTQLSATGNNNSNQLSDVEEYIRLDKEGGLVELKTNDPERFNTMQASYLTSLKERQKK